VIRGPYRVDRSQLHFDGTPPSTSKEIEAGIHREPMQPGVEPVRIAEARKVPPRADESILNSVLRQVGIPKDQPGGGVEPSQRTVDELGKGGMVASPRRSMSAR
jgi:hypothetical protein